MTKISLQKYREKRDFQTTPEPSGSQGKSKGGRFVIQKHDASNLHYDFRLEIDDVLVSWAVPKGPSLDPSQKRLAIRTEDHPPGYIDFEGVIPKGQYGAGTVLVWDTGTYHNLKRNKSMPEALDQGSLEFELRGEKLRGQWSLFQFQAEKDQWLLVKKDDPFAARDAPITEDQPLSVLSGRELQKIAEQMNSN